MTIEDRLRRAIAARTRSVDPSDDGLRRINEKLLEHGDDMRFETPNNRWYLVAAAAVVVAMIAGGVVLATGDDDGPTNTADQPTDDTTTTAVDDTTTTSTADSTTTTSTPGVDTTVAPTPAGPPADAVPYIVWPRPSSDVRFDDPVAAASSWARFYAGFADPLIGDFRAADNRSGEVPVFPLSSGQSPETTVLVQQMGDDHWYVVASITEDITVTAPTGGAQLSCPQRFQGTALAYEGTVQVRIDAYQADGDRVTVGSGIVTGGGGPAAPFDGRIDCTLPTGVEPYGIVMLATADESGEPGRSGTWEATTFPVKLG